MKLPESLEDLEKEEEKVIAINMLTCLIGIFWGAWLIEIKSWWFIAPVTFMVISLIFIQRSFKRIDQLHELQQMDEIELKEVKEYGNS